MKLEDLDALVALARCGSILAAANTTGVPRTTIRRRLARLEETVGGPVASVGAHGVKLTAAGRFLLEKAPLLIARHGSVLEEARRLGQRRSGLLRVLIGRGFPPMFAARAFAGLSALVPELRFELHHALRPLDRLDDGYDIVVHWGEPPPPREGYSRVIVRQPRQLMASPAYLERRGRPTTVGALTEHTLLGLSAEASFWPLQAGGLVPIEPDHLVDDFYLLGCLAAEGLGIALLPQTGIGLAPEFEALVPVLEDEIGGDIVARVFLPAKARAGSAPRELLDLVLQLWRDEIESVPRG